MIKGIAHVALYTERFDDTIKWYQEVFDAKILGYFETNVRGCWLVVGKDVLEIFESSKYGDGIFKHIAVSCDDVDTLYNRALEKGALPHVEPKNVILEMEKPVKARIAFIKGINGEKIELFEEELL